MSDPMNIVFIGLAVSSSWGNGHATTYRSLLKGLSGRGHRLLFLEKDQPWYAAHRDPLPLPYCEVQLYRDLTDLRTRFASRLAAADAVIVGSYVDDGRRVCEWVLENARGVRGFYDIDTPVTLSQLRDDACPYLALEHIPQFDVFLSFSGGGTLDRLERVYGAKRAHALYCSVDPEEYRPASRLRDLDLGYLGTYSADRQPALQKFLMQPAVTLASQSFAVVGAQYPDTIEWPTNVLRIGHLSPEKHAAFYSRQRFTLNVTRADMRAAGHSPSVRLFEAAACGTPIISDAWPGLDEVLTPNEQILVVDSTLEVTKILTGMQDAQRARIARSARERALAEHSGSHRAAELEQILRTASTNGLAGEKAARHKHTADTFPNSRERVSV
ncbi:MAG: glycosyltransferase [Povalibacter sp.]